MMMCPQIYLRPLFVLFTYCLWWCIPATSAGQEDILTKVQAKAEAASRGLAESRREIDEEKIPLRLGFIYDSKTTNFKYPSGFSTPPVHTYSVTAGIGYDHGPWELNIAYARRFGKVLIDDPENPQTPTTQDASLTRGELVAECPACGYAGDYRFRINGFYIDFSYDWK